MTVRALFARWLDHKRGDLRRRTLERYRKMLEIDVLPEIGNLEMHKVRPAHVQRVVDRHRERGLTRSPFPSP
jgi:hypothetical protein